MSSYFKFVNDEFGHVIGDKLLALVAQRLNKTSRLIDFIARLGGDEFALIIEDLELEDEVNKITSRILYVFKEPFELEEHELRVTVSIGGAIFPDAGNTGNELLKNADIAMYRAKESGKNQFQVFNLELKKQVKRNHQIQLALPKAIETKSFEVFYQPQIEAKTEKLIGVEALVRWPNEELNHPSPSEFIPIAERNNQIVPLGNWVLEQAMKDYQKIMSETGYEIPDLSVNVSSLQLSHDIFYRNTKYLLSKLNFKHKNLVLEVTETSLLKDIKQAREILDKFDSIGIRFALDDFGTGYSSLSYLKNLPISILKIDRAFVRDIETDDNDKTIINAIISLAQSLQIKTLAEGVEEECQLNFLKTLGCDIIQGYYFAQPMSLKALIQFIKNLQL